MHVTAFSTPAQPAWRWRIINYGGEIIEESQDGFPTVAAAVARGTERLAQMNVVDRSLPPRRQWTTGRQRGR